MGMQNNNKHLNLFNYLIFHWRGRGKRYRWASVLLSILRSFRTLLFFDEHKKLCQLDVYQNYVSRIAKDDLFHHLNHRYYLIKNISVTQRVQCACSHYQLENDYFNTAYKQAVYLTGNLTLWSKTVNDVNYSIQLSAGFRTVPEGDLCIALFVNQISVHKISFTWIKGEIFKLESQIVPFIGRNQAGWGENLELRQQFNLAFPHNAPVYFCISALQGLAKSIGATQILGVSSENQVGFHPTETQHFVNTYDVYWESIGGKKLATLAYVIPVPFYVKPLSEVSVKHRKRKADRRKQWDEIDNAANMALSAHLLPELAKPLTTGGCALEKSDHNRLQDAPLQTVEVITTETRLQ